MARVTDHAAEKGKQRLGLNKSAITRLAQKALDKGFGIDSSRGKLRKYINQKLDNNPADRFIKVWGENIFVFQKDVLVTVYRLPSDYIRIALKIAGRLK